jgi:hypothetical protein
MMAVCPQESQATVLGQRGASGITPTMLWERGTGKTARGLERSLGASRGPHSPIILSYQAIVAKSNTQSINASKSKINPRKFLAD